MMGLPDDGKKLVVISRFDTIHQRDRQTDRQTDTGRQQRPRYA